MPKIHHLLLICLACLCAACSVFSSKKKPDPTTPKKKPASTQQLVGRVGSVASDQTFALIQMYHPAVFTNGTVLTTQGENPADVSNLRVSGERKDSYMAADVQSGTPRLGDAVFYSPPARDEKPKSDPPPTTDPKTPPKSAPKTPETPPPAKSKP